ncbi:hypothetical protein AVEN_131650-1 [Araneus ventricosus]|uniref:Uncharacterized protein n=1 Tax=Araneus ventricosus TaxID=182803 RepID=A0A4Y2M4J8_ARAVE|nr:hypothetical protein AVEN_131650-1 [Araneus ventricosus]
MEIGIAAWGSWNSNELKIQHLMRRFGPRTRVAKQNGYSSAELLMGSKLRTNLSMAKKSLMPKIPKAEDIRKELKYGVNEKQYYDKHHRVKDLQELEPGQVVWMVLWNLRTASLALSH